MVCLVHLTRIIFRVPCSHVTVCGYEGSWANSNLWAHSRSSLAPWGSPRWNTCWDKLLAHPAQYPISHTKKGTICRGEKGRRGGVSLPSALEGELWGSLLKNLTRPLRSLEFGVVYVLSIGIITQIAIFLKLVFCANHRLGSTDFMWAFTLFLACY